MDTSKLSQGEMVAAIGGIVLIVSLFLTWTDLPFGGTSAFDIFSGMDIIMLVIAVAVVGAAAATATGTALTLPVSPGLVTFVLGVGLVGWTLGWALEDPNAGIGSWLALGASIAIVYGGFMESRLSVAPAGGTASATPPPAPPPPQPTGSAGAPSGGSTPPPGV